MSRVVLGTLGVVLLFVAVGTPADAETADRQKAARGMGYANYVGESKKCDGTITNQAIVLQNDIGTYYNFTHDDLLGTTEIGKAVRKGQAAARHDASHPEYRGEFCDRMDETLGLWRSDVLPSPK